jgi:hypothetical protein
MTRRHDWDKAKSEAVLAGATPILGEEIVSKADMIPRKFTRESLRRAMQRAMLYSRAQAKRIARPYDRQAARLQPRGGIGSR